MLCAPQSALVYRPTLAQSRLACFRRAGRLQAGLYLALGATGTSDPWCCAGGIIGPYLIGALSDKYSYGAAMITLGAFNLLAALLFTTFPGAATPSKLHPHFSDVPRGVLVRKRLLLHMSLSPLRTPKAVRAADRCWVGS